MKQQRTPAGRIAMGGVFAALAIVIMSLGGLIPVATYTSPMLCAVILQLVLLSCGRRIAWAWFGAVAFLSLLLSPDKEAAAVFAALGYYPIIKPWMDGRRAAMLWKLAFFNGSILLLYWLLLHILGLQELNSDFAEFGQWMLGIMLLLGNITFFLLDKLLSRNLIRRRS